MTKDEAQAVALKAAAHIIADDRALAALFAQSGIGEDHLRDNIGDPGLLAGILDYLLGDEKLLVAFCAESGLAPELPARARALLPGAAQED